jgi:hypothetical protein
MKTISNVALACAAVSLCACAELPKAKIHYYYPQTNLSLEVLRAVACDSSNHLIELFKVTPTVTYTADRTSDVQTLDIYKLNTAFSDTDITVKLTDDGRLQSVNGTGTGEGESILKSALTVAALVMASGSGVASTESTPLKSDELCRKIAAAAPDGKALTLTYTGFVSFNDHLEVSRITLEPESSGHDQALLNSLDELVAFPGPSPDRCAPLLGAPVVNEGEALQPITFTDEKNKQDRLAVKLLNPALIRVTVCTKRDMKKQWEKVFPITQRGSPYSVYFAKPASFGKEQLQLVLNDAGFPTTLQYVKNSGASSALNAIDNAAGLHQSAETAELAKRKLQDDLASELRYRVACKADVKNCK